MWQGQRIGVVIPAYNEARLVGATLAAVPGYVDRVYLVDDCSTDETRARCLALGLPRVVVIRHSKNQGVGAAIVSGYQRGIRDGMDVLAVMAGDGQMAPEDLPALLAATNRADYAKGNRFIHSAARRMPLERRMGSRFLSWLTRLTTGLAVDDCQCGYTAIRASVASELPLAELWPRYGYPNDLLRLLALAGRSVGEVAVTPVYATETSGLHPGHVVSIGARILGRYWSSRSRSREALWAEKAGSSPG